MSSFFPLCAPGGNTIRRMFAESGNGKESLNLSWFQILIRITTKI